MSCDFTYEHYKFILNQALSVGYNICGCFEYLNNDRKNKTIVMRHDVDKFPIRAYDFAEMEYVCGIKSTYFFRVFSDEYNIFGYETMAIIKDIERMGHEIGYHAEPIDVSQSYKEISPIEAFKMGKDALELLLGHKIFGVASHREATGYNNLTEFISKYKPIELDVMYEAYDNEILNLFNNSYYITDGYEWYWRSFRKGKIISTTECLCKILNQYENVIYCLTHPNSWYKHHYHRVKY